MVDIWRTRAGRGSAVTYAVAVLLLWPIPLLNVLHVESCAVMAVAAFLVSGFSTLRLLGLGLPVGRIVRWQVALLGLPLALMTVPVLWAPNCSYPVGLLFFGLFPTISAVLAFSLAFLLYALDIRHQTFLFGAATLLVTVITPLYDLGLFPQLYTYNHVFGGILGPIYDEQLAVRTGLFAFRGLTLLWALTLFLAGRVALRRPGVRHPLTLAALASSLALLVAYAASPILGWNTTHDAISRTLGDMKASGHFDIYYDARSARPGEIDEILDELEFRYEVLSDELDTDIPERVRIYLYPTEKLKGRLTGSRSTSVAPVWLRHPQIHMLLRRAGGSLDHELVHVFSREFGIPVVKASASVGLVEGLASSLEAPDGAPSPSDLMAAVIQEGSRDSSEVVSGLTSALGAFGFWTGRGAVSYAATGSFVRHLLDAYGVGAFKSAYPLARFESAYGKPVEELAAEWYAAVRRGPPVSAAALPAAETRFSVPSLFEVECPHAVPPSVASYRRGLDYLALHDTVAAVRSFDLSLQQQSDYLPARAQLGSIHVRRREYQSALSLVAADTVAMEYPQMMVLAADAYAMAGDAQQAASLYDQVVELSPDYATELRLVLRLRQRLAQEAAVAGWFFSDAPQEPLPDELADNPLMPVYRLMRALGRDDSQTACEAAASMTETPLLPDELDDPGDYGAHIVLWQAQACVHGGRPDLAERWGREAERRFRTAHRSDLARYAADRAAFAQWKLSESTGRTSFTFPDVSVDSPDP